MLFLDTHVVVWLYEKRQDLFSQTAHEAVEQHDLCVSPIVHLELEYLFETNRMNVRAGEVTEYLSRVVELRTDSGLFAEVVARATRMKWTRDPFDRVITAHADLTDSPLLTRDRRIHTHYPNAVW